LPIEKRERGEVRAILKAHLANQQLVASVARKKRYWFYIVGIGN